MIHAIKPVWEIWVYGFLPEKNENFLHWLNEGEKTFLKTPFRLPNILIESFTYSDDLENSNFSITIPNGFNKILYDSQNRELRLSELLDEGTVIEIKENDKTVFAGYVLSVSDSGNINASDSMSISGGGLESAIKEQLMVIDNPAYKTDNGTKDITRDVVYSGLTSNLVGAFTAMTKIIENLKNPCDAVGSLADHAIKYTLNRGKYGGKKFSEFFLTKSGLSKESYSKDYISKISLVNEANTGKSINFWQMMDDFAKRPLYEMFVHYNQDHELFLDSTNKSVKNKKGTLGELVFRQTPIESLADIDDENYTMFYINQSVFDSFRLSCNLRDIFSGISIKPGFLSNTSHATYFVPILYNLSLVQKFGQRIFTVVLDGISFPKEGKTKAQAQEQAKSSIEHFNSIQKKFMKVFGTGERIVSGTFSGTYNREISKGKVMHLVNNEGKEILAKGLERYDNRFYVTGTTVNVNFSAGKADMDVNVKWGRRKSRVKV